jgi:putative transposase
MLNMCYTWFRRGSGKQFEVPTRWGSKGRLNVIGTLSLHGEREQLEVRELEGACNQTQVVGYLETLAEACKPERLTVVVLDNAPFHKGEQLKKRRAAWEAKGLYLRYLPAYCPQLNLIEGVWRKLKGFLMPRRCYDNLNQLQEALRVGLKALKATII